MLIVEKPTLILEVIGKACAILRNIVPKRAADVAVNSRRGRHLECRMHALSKVWIPERGNETLSDNFQNTHRGHSSHFGFADRSFASASRACRGCNVGQPSRSNIGAALSIKPSTRPTYMLESKSASKTLRAWFSESSLIVGQPSRVVVMTWPKI